MAFAAATATPVCARPRRHSAHFARGLRMPPWNSKCVRGRYNVHGTRRSRRGVARPAGDLPPRRSSAGSGLLPWDGSFGGTRERLQCAAQLLHGAEHAVFGRSGVTAENATHFFHRLTFVVSEHEGRPFHG